MGLWFVRGEERIINHGKTFWDMNVFVSVADIWWFRDTPPSQWDNYANPSGHSQMISVKAE